MLTADRWPGPPIKRIHVARRRTMADVRARNGEHKIDQHAAVQGEGIDGTLIDDFANAGILRFQQFARSGHRNRLSVLVDTQRDIEGGLLSDFEDDVLAGLCEALAVDGQRIAAGLKSGNLVESCCIRNNFALQLPCLLHLHECGRQQSCDAGDRKRNRARSRSCFVHGLLTRATTRQNGANSNLRNLTLLE